MQKKLTKEEKETWLSQLVVTKINKDIISELLELIVESISSMYELYSELGLSKAACRDIFREMLEDKTNQQNSMVLMDASSNKNKFVGVRSYLNMRQYDQNPPKEEDFSYKGYLLKCQLVHELFSGVFHLDFNNFEYETTPIFFIHPECANIGLANYMNKLYAIDAYQRGVQKFVNVVFNPVMLKIQLSVKGGNPYIANEISLEDRELEGKKAFQKFKRGYIIVIDLQDIVLEQFGVDVQSLKKDKNINTEIK